MAIDGIIPFLWFDTEALEAAKFYVSLFPDSRMGDISHYVNDAQRPKGSVLAVELEIFGQRFAALNGGPEFPHSEAISFQMHCDTQDEIDRIWDALVANGGEESMCGWCKDRWGVSWQIVPKAFRELYSGSDEVKANRAFEAMMTMRKLDSPTFEAILRD